ncbi:DsbA family oxidoreductase [Ornithinibacillus massiliensis]|uniref:DsbA family oxidoreductase n=1 Tax=Ornithinibacillus massiliensis TaxID=1944633 RepID=A0ABS5MGJ5_9BACI|nr:DsbA family oxidoreductase [Ornithinibacillus massiliensis]MBS3681466.1 DsbA family oxidoreductase [Ornithinibacillus massiliensis]
MKIEIWSDFVCPFCYIGKRRLELALHEFEYRENVQIVFRSYELYPDADAKTELSIHEFLAAKKGMPIEQAKQLNENVGKQAASVGLTYNFETMQHANTFDAHRLAKYADTKHLGTEITEKLLHAYFTDGELISDYSTLKRLATEVGLDLEEVEELLLTNRYAKRVRDDEELAEKIGVSGVPFFVFNEKYAISGAQPKEVFQEVLEKVWEEESKQPTLQNINPKESKTSYCTGEGCEVED